MKLRILFCLLFLLPLYGNAQCGFDDLYHRRMQTDTAFSRSVTAMRREYNAYREALKTGKLVISGADTSITIPLVIHMIHTGAPVGSPVNPSDSQLRVLVKYTDDLFNGKLPGINGVKTNIHFVLARTDQNCQPMTGIYRVDGSGIPNYTKYGINSGVGTGQGADEVAVRNLSRKNWSDYFNVWLVNQTDAGVTGYARAALGFPAPDYGPVIVSWDAIAGSFTLAHELGHSLGLLHTFEGDNNGAGCPPLADCANTGDFICDTEPDRRAPDCGAILNPCTSLPYGAVRSNVMNYSNCNAFEFTAEQAAYMRWVARRFVPSIYSVSGDTLTGQVAVQAACVNQRAALFDSMGAVCGPTFVQFGDITRVSSSCRADECQVYLDNTCLYRTKLEAGRVYPLTLRTGAQPQYVRAYLDLNNDGVFQVPAEQLVDTLFPGGSSVQAATFDIALPPSGVVTDKPLRLRIFADGKLHAGAGPCAAIVSGQAEDYAVTITPSLGIHPAGLRPELSLAPNPAGTTTTLSYELTQPAAVRLLVVDATGRVVFSTQPAGASAGKHTAEIQVSNLAPGIYAVMLSINGTVSATRLSVLR